MLFVEVKVLYFDMLWAGKGYGEILNNKRLAKISDTGLLFHGEEREVYYY